jgi:serine/threonine protein kinase/Tol biopolymer transport system component
MSMIGKTLAHYEITSQLGKGGMGEVYQAKDRKLGRDVAIKVLPEEFAMDADRVARFQREAKLLASLNHTNIAAIYGLEASEQTNFLVLELVEGETLADRIKAGPIPVEESLKLALQIAEALEAAHKRGVIHRDLKPANIKVTPDGKVKVLDFGLAKAFGGEQAELNLSNSPTLSNAATQMGVILGTAAYMSPEQARGKSVDKRTDIWAFGCVLYEMLTGQAAFQGEDVTEILAAVVKGGANLDPLPANLHFRVREAITRCLQKDLKKRYQDVGDVRYEIEQSLADPSGVLVKPLAATERQSKLQLILPWVAAAVVVAAIIAGVAVWKFKPPESNQVSRFSHELPREQQFGSFTNPLLAVSPDGRQFVYCTPRGIYLRSMDELDAKLIRGTEENPRQPFFSSDGQWIGYWSSTENQLKKISISRGIPVSLTNDTPNGFLSWNTNDTIIYSGTKGIMRIPAKGGSPETVIEAKNETFFTPRLLPGGKAVIFTITTDQGYHVAVQSLASGKRKTLTAGSDAYYSPTGHLVYIFGKDLCAIPFDLDALDVTGGSIPIVKDIFRSGGAPQFAVSASGTLVYLQGTAEIRFKRTLVWVDKNGNEEPLAAPQDAYGTPRISPDGTKVALKVGWPYSHVWILDLVRNNITRLFPDTNPNALESLPIWTPPNGQQIAFYGSGGSNFGIACMAANGTGNIEHYSQPGRGIYPACWSSDGKNLLAMIAPLGGENYDIGMLSMEGGPKWRQLLHENYSELQPQISPNGRWMAYTSNESGQYEVYVRPFPEVDKGRWQVSTSGGDSPLWSPEGRELFYRSGDAVNTVPVKTDPGFSYETRKQLFQKPYVSADMGISILEIHPWDIRPDGKRFLMMKESEPAAADLPQRINIVLNWFEELKQRIPVK